MPTAEQFLKETKELDISPQLTAERFLADTTGEVTKGLGDVRFEIEPQPPVSTFVSPDVGVGEKVPRTLFTRVLEKIVPFEEEPTIPEGDPAFRLGQGLIHGFTGLDPIEGKTEEEKEGVKGDPYFMVGEIAGFTGGYIGAVKVVGTLTKPAVKLLRPWALRALNSTLSGLGLGGVQQLTRKIAGQKVDIDAPAKLALLFGTFDVGLAVLGKTGRGIFNLIRQRNYKKAARLYEEAVRAQGESVPANLESVFKIYNEQYLALPAPQIPKLLSATGGPLGVATEVITKEVGPPLAVPVVGATRKQAQKQVQQFEKQLKLVERFKTGDVLASRLPKDREKLRGIVRTINLRKEQAAERSIDVLREVRHVGDPIANPTKKAIESVDDIAKQVSDIVEADAEATFWQGAKKAGSSLNAMYRFLLTRSKKKFKSNPGKEFLAMFERHTLERERFAGEWDTWVKDNVQRLTKDEGNGLGEFMLRQGKPKDAKLASAYDELTEAYGKIGNELEKAKIPVVGLDGRVRSFDKRLDFGMPHQIRHDWANDIREDMERLLSDADLFGKVKAVKTGVGRDFTKKELDETLDVLWRQHFDDFSPKTKALAGLLLKTNLGKKPSEVAHFLFDQTDYSLFPIVGSVNRSRAWKLPFEVLEKNAYKVYAKYIQGAARKLSEARNFGPKREGLSSVLGRIESSTFRNTEIDEARRILLIDSGAEGLRYPKFIRQIDNAVVSFEYLSKISTQLGATIANLSQPAISYLPKMSLGRMFQSGWRWISNPTTATDFVQRSGAVNRFSAYKRMTGAEAKGTFGAITESTGFHFNFVNKMLQYSAADAGRQNILAMHEYANGRGFWNRVLPHFGKRWRKDWAQKSLKDDYGIDWRKPVTEDDMLLGIAKFAKDTQLQHDVMADFIWMNTTLGRPLAVLKRFGTKQFFLAKDTILKEARRGNVMPIVRMAAYGYLGGELVQWGRSWFNVGVAKASNRFMEVLGKDDIPKPVRRKRWEDYVSWERALNNYAAVATLGFVSDFVELLGFERDERRAEQAVRRGKFFFTPVILDDAFDLWEGATYVAKQFDQYPDFTDAIARSRKYVFRYQPFVTLKKAAEQVQTRAQYEATIRFRRGRARGYIMDLMANGKYGDVVRDIRKWNDENPAVIVITNIKGEKVPFRVHLNFVEDFSFNEMLNRRINKALKQSRP